ncbi:hypothetical protein DL98DRAFT_142137 [Cadophora sp. DSE1049]|nr:hypothetical protein DL98DRAFT_142137 [Cadophora sp. DSE1049]
MQEIKAGLHSSLVSGHQYICTSPCICSCTDVRKKYIPFVSRPSSHETGFSVSYDEPYQISNKLNSRRLPCSIPSFFTLLLYLCCIQQYIPTHHNPSPPPYHFAVPAYHPSHQLSSPSTNTSTNNITKLINILYVKSFFRAQTKRHSSLLYS